jgi:sugar porter (SP) family MFS transporter
VLRVDQSFLHLAQQQQQQQQGRAATAAQQRQTATTTTSSLPLCIEFYQTMPELEKSLSEQHIEVHQSGEEADTVATNLDTSITRASYWDNKKILAVSLFINLSTLEYGIDQGTVNGFQAMPGFLAVFGYADPALPGGYGITTEVQQLITSLVSLGMLIAVLTVGYSTYYIGRKGGIWVSCVLMIISVTIQITTVTIGGLYAGRFILGLANGYLILCGQLYMQECIPAHLRSFNYTLYQVWVALGSLLGAIINNSTSVRPDRTSYQIPLTINYVGTAILGLGLFALPESPRLLYSKGKKEQAYKSLRWLRDSSYTDMQVEEELAEIAYGVETDLQITKDVGFFDIFKRQNLKRTMTSAGLCCLTTACGGQFIFQYGTYFFLLSGDTDPFRSIVILLTVGLVGGLVTPLFSGRVGKRPILITGSIFMALCMLGMAMSYSIRGIDKTSGKVIKAMSMIFMFFYGSTISPFNFQVAVEIPSQPLRGHTFAFGSCLTFLFGWLLVFTAPYFVNPTALNWGAQYGYWWVPANFIAAIFVFFCVPETNKRTLEEIDECYNEKVPIRKFAQHKCVGTQQARQAAAIRHKNTAA